LYYYFGWNGIPITESPPNFVELEIVQTESRLKGVNTARTAVNQLPNNRVQYSEYFVCASIGEIVNSGYPQVNTLTSAKNNVK